MILFNVTQLGSAPALQSTLTTLHPPAGGLTRPHPQAGGAKERKHQMAQRNKPSTSCLPLIRRQQRLQQLRPRCFQSHKSGRGELFIRHYFTHSLIHSQPALPLILEAQIIIFPHPAGSSRLRPLPGPPAEAPTSLVKRGTPRCQRWSFSRPLYTAFPKTAMLPDLHNVFPARERERGRY